MASDIYTTVENSHTYLGKDDIRPSQLFDIGSGAMDKIAKNVTTKAIKYCYKTAALIAGGMIYNYR